MKPICFCVALAFLGALNFPAALGASDGMPPTTPPTGPPVFVPARFDQQALDASAGGLLLPNREELRQPPITVECWARLHDANDFNILVTSDTKASSLHWELYTYKGTGCFGVFLPGMGGDFPSNKPICDERWHHVAMVLESTRVLLFVDGEMVRDSSLSAPAGVPVPGDIAIGRLVEGVHGCDGYIQDVRISRGARDVRDVPLLPLQRGLDTLELWPLNGSVQPAPPGISTGLPVYKIVPAAKREELTPANGWPAASTSTQWTRSNGGSASNRYVTYTEINKQNVSQLTQAWIYHSRDGEANIQCNPIYLDGLLYIPTAGLCMVALDAATGREMWRFEPEKQGNGLEDVPARRGLIYWPGDGGHPARILFTMGTWIYALDPKIGKPIDSFGQNGRAPLPPGGSSVPAVIYKDILIYPGFADGVFGYDVRTGEKLWTFNTLPRGREFGAATWDSDNERNGANSWGGAALDESRGIYYASTGSPKPNFLGMSHTGDDLFGNCVLALDASTGRLLWYFQEIRHDIWDLDIPGPPNLVTVEHDGMKVDAVADVTKMGNTLLLDRVTGKPLFPFRLRRAPDFKLPGERGAIYQPDPELPAPLVRQTFTLGDVTNRTPAAHDAVMKSVLQSSYGWYSPFEENKPNVYFCLEGGGEWTGASVDPDGRLYDSVSEIPWVITVSRVFDAGTPATPLAKAGETVYRQSCVACHRITREGNGFAPSLIGLETRRTEDDVRQMIHKGRNGMPPQPQLSEDQIAAVCAYVLNQGGGAPGPVRWTSNGYPKLLDPQGYPGSTPPWGKLICLDLNTGHIVWQVPLGEYPELTTQGVPKTGTQTFGGPTVTSTRLIFVSGTKDPTIGAYDCDTGAQLWSHALPLHGTAPPIIYETKGHEYIALPATGGGKLGGPVGDAWVAFALPQAVTHSDSTVVSVDPPAIAGALTATGIAGTAFNYQIAASNAPTSYGASGLPAGLSVNPALGLISGTATTAGTFNATISATNARGTGYASFIITIKAAFATWEHHWFTPAQLADPAICGETANPTGDGIPNLMKYGLNLNPMVKGAGGSLAGSLMTVSGTNYLELSYTHVISATDISYAPEVSGDKQTWNSGEAYIAPVSVTPNSDGVTETVVVRDRTPTSNGTPRFIRLKVTEP